VIAGSLAAPRVRRAMPAGLAGVAAGCAILALGGPLLAALPTMGAGLGVASVASTRVGMGDDGRGVASGVLNTAAQLGTAIGLAVLVPLADALGFAWGWAACAAIALGSSVACGSGAARRGARRPVGPDGAQAEAARREGGLPDRPGPLAGELGDQGLGEGGVRVHGRDPAPARI
jgi:hypothetical protein